MPATGRPAPKLCSIDIDLDLLSQMRTPGTARLHVQGCPQAWSQFEKVEDVTLRNIKSPVFQFLEKLASVKRLHLIGQKRMILHDAEPQQCYMLASGESQRVFEKLEALHLDTGFAVPGNLHLPRCTRIVMTGCHIMPMAIGVARIPGNPLTRSLHSGKHRDGGHQTPALYICTVARGYFPEHPRSMARKKP